MNNSFATNHTKTIPKIYIAGPMRGYQHFNFPAFDKAKEHLEARGFHVINPADIDRQIFGWPKYPDESHCEISPALSDAIIRRDLAILFELEPYKDGLYLLRGWRASSGANVEQAVSVYRHLRLMYQEYND